MTLLDGKEIARQIRAELRQEIDLLRANGQRVPRLCIVNVGNNPASETYIANKVKACNEVGIRTVCISFKEEIPQEALLEEVRRLNKNPEVDGIIVQLPLPAHIKEQVITAAIDYRKDVDGLTCENIGRTMLGLSGIVSATPRGIRELLRRYHIPTEGKHVVIVGRSNIVGKPMANLLVQKSEGGNATVTLCHSHTHDLPAICRTADIIIMATGQPKLLTADMVREGATVVDVGITRVKDTTCPKGYRLYGDVDFEGVSRKAAYISPVPGGVGPMTIVSLLQNTLQAYRQQQAENCL